MVVLSSRSATPEPTRFQDRVRQNVPLRRADVGGLHYKDANQYAAAMGLESSQDSLALARAECAKWWENEAPGEIFIPRRTAPVAVVPAPAPATDRVGVPSTMSLCFLDARRGTIQQESSC